MSNLWQMKLNFRGSSTLTDTEKSQPSSETELSGNKQEQERKDKQEEKIPRDYYARDLENVETVIEKKMLKPMLQMVRELIYQVN